MKRSIRCWVTVFMFMFGLRLGLGQSYMDPPGMPGSAEAWVKPLNMVEPRTMITALPYQITSPGSYYLVSNLVGRTGDHGITISASDVKLDLNGFALVGLMTSPYDGIYVSGAGLNNITIQNGAVRRWGLFGINAASGKGIQIAGVKSYANEEDGMYLGQNAMVKECLAFDNGGWGFDLGVNSVVIDCEARGNTNMGIRVGTASKVRGCVALENGESGIVADSNSTISSCSAIQNDEDGILVDSNCRVVDNNCIGNGVGPDPGAGIHATGGRNRIQDNNVALNDCGIQTDSSGNLVIRNSASGNGTLNDYDLKLGTIFGRVERDFSNGEIGLVSPWANFSF